MWLLEIVMSGVLLLGLYFVFKHIIQRLRARPLEGAIRWKERIGPIFLLPFQILLWVLGLSFVLEILAKHFGFGFFESYISALRSTGIIICLAWMLVRWKGELQRHFLHKESERGKADAGVVYVAGNIFTIAVLILALLIILQMWGLNIAPLLAFGGIGAAAVGFAAKDFIANFFGGLMLHLHRSFVVGDVILLPDKHLEGHVEVIGWYLTIVRDKDKRPVYLPNAFFSQMLVINVSRMSHRRIEERVGIRYDDVEKVSLLTENIRHAVTSHPDIDVQLPCVAVFNTFAPYTLTLYLDMYTLQTRYEKYLQVRQDILLRVYQEVRKVGAEMPMPMLSIFQS